MHDLLEALKIVAPILVSYIALLRTRTDLDRYIASQRARDHGSPPASFEKYMRRRWYHKFFRTKRKPPR